MHSSDLVLFRKRSYHKYMNSKNRILITLFCLLVILSIIFVMREKIKTFITQSLTKTYEGENLTEKPRDNLLNISSTTENVSSTTEFRFSSPAQPTVISKVFYGVKDIEYIKQSNPLAYKLILQMSSTSVKR